MMDTNHKDAATPPDAAGNVNPRRVTCLYTTGQIIQTFSFADRRTMFDWDKEILAIKGRMDWISEQWYPHPRRSLYRVWLQEVYDFCGVFGNDYVPADIRTSVNSVERGLGLPVTRW